MQILADENVPEAYVSALIGDGHRVVVSRDVPELGPGSSDRTVVEYAEREGMAVLSTDVKDFDRMDADVTVLVAPQDMTGGAVRRAVNRLESMDFDPSGVEPIWLSAL